MWFRKGLWYERLCCDVAGPDGRICDKCLRFNDKSMKLQTDREENRQEGRQADSQRGRQAVRYTTKY
jgi:hypothetical protein